MVNLWQPNANLRKKEIISSQEICDTCCNEIQYDNKKEENDMNFRKRLKMVYILRTYLKGSLRVMRGHLLS